MIALQEEARRLREELEAERSECFYGYKARVIVEEPDYKELEAYNVKLKDILSALEPHVREAANKPKVPLSFASFDEGERKQQEEAKQAEFEKLVNEGAEVCERVVALLGALVTKSTGAV